MTEDQKHIDKLFSNGLKNFSQKAPPNAWQRLDEDLNRAGRRKVYMFFRLAAASILLLLAFGAGYFYAVNFSDEQNIADTENSSSLVTESSNILPIAQESDSVIEIQNDSQNNVLESTANASTRANTKNEEMLLAGSETFSKDDPLTHILSTKQHAEKGTSEIKEIQINALGALLFSGGIALQSVDPIDMPAKTSHYTDLAVIHTIDANTVINTTSNEEVYTYSGLPDNPQKLKWTIGAQIAPTVSYRDISTNYGTNPAIDINNEKQLDQAEESLLAYSGGLQIDMHMNKKWGLQSGLYFSRIGYVNTDALEFVQQSKGYILTSIQTSTGDIDFTFEKVPENIRNLDAPKDSVPGDFIKNVKVIQNFDLFEVPFLVNYHILSKKLSLKLAGGISPAYLLDNRTLLELESESYDVGQASNLNNLIVNSSIGLGIGYQFLDKFTFSLEPTFKYALNPINNNSNFNYHPYYLSWFTGLKYTF